VSCEPVYTVKRLDVVLHELDIEFTQVNVRTRCNQLSNRLYNQLDNRLCRVIGMS